MIIRFLDRPLRLALYGSLSALCFALSGCGGGSSGGGNDNVDEGDGALTPPENTELSQPEDPTDEGGTSALLQGEWLFCASIFYMTIEFDGNRWERNNFTNNSQDCENPQLDPGLSFGGTFVLGDPTTSADGLEVTPINFVFEGLVGNQPDTNFDIVFTGTQDQLLFGLFPGIDEEGRATALNFDAVYLRQ